MRFIWVPHHFHILGGYKGDEITTLVCGLLGSAIGEGPETLLTAFLAEELFLEGSPFDRGVGFGERCVMGFQVRFQNKQLPFKLAPPREVCERRRNIAATLLGIVVCCLHSMTT